MPNSHNTRSSIVRPHHHIISSSLAGMAGIVVGFPLDLVRVRLNTQHTTASAQRKRSNNNTARYISPRGLLHYMRNIVHREGVRALYRGCSSPLVAQTFHKTMVFYSNAKLQNMLGIHSVMNRQSSGTQSSSSKNFDNAIAERTKVQWAQYMLCGAVTGALGSLVLTPMENVKVNLQVASHHTTGKSRRAVAARYEGSLDCFNKLVQREGFARLYKALPAVALRDAVYHVAYLPAYEAALFATSKIISAETTTTTSSQYDEENKVLRFMRCGFSGGLAGVVAWTAASPLDCIKNRFQTESSTTRYRSLMHCARDTYRKGGLALLYSGLVPSVLRAFPVHCTFWLTYEVAQSLLAKQQ